MKSTVRRSSGRLLRYCRAAALVLTCLAGAATPARAQVDSLQRLREVQVLGNRPPRVQTTTPTQQLSALEFRRYSAYTVADAIRSFAGVNLRDYGGIGGLKTVSVRSLGANHTAVLYDGVPVNDAQNGQVDLGKFNLDNVSAITLFNGQPTEICQPARVYAAASVLSLRTLPPPQAAERPTRLRVGLRGGSFGLFNPSAQLLRRLNDRWSVALNGNWQRAHGRYKYRVEGDGSDTSRTRTNAEIKAVQADAALFWARSDSNRFHLRAFYYNSDRGLPGAVVFYNPYSRQHLWTNDVFVQGQYERIGRNRLHLLLTGKLTQSYQRYLDPDYLNQAGKLDNRYTQREYYQSASLAYKLYDNWEVSYAVDGFVSTLQTRQYGFAYPTRLTLLNVAASSLRLGRTHWQANLLHTRIREWVRTDDGPAAPSRSVLTPTLLLTVTPLRDPALLLRAFYKDIFRNPTFNDLYYTRVGNRQLRPERARQFNLGVTYSRAFAGWLDYLALTADGYYNHVQDKIIAVPVKDLFSWSMQNLGRVDITGLDVGLKAQAPLIRSWKAVVNGTYTLQQAIDVTDPASTVYGAQIPYTPRHTFATNVGARTERFGLYYNQIFSSGRYSLSENLPEYFVPGFLVSDASATYSFAVASYPATAAVEVNNLFNTPYALITSFPMPGRSVRFSIQFTFQ